MIAKWIERQTNFLNALAARQGKEPHFTMKTDGKTGRIDVYDTIGPSWMGLIGADRFAKALKDLGDVKEIHLHINSPGGFISEGLTIYNQLNAHKAKVIVNVDGIAASIASVIAMAGDTIRIAENGFFMVHRAEAIAFGTAPAMRETADLLETLEGSIRGTYRARTGQKDEDLQSLMEAGTDNSGTWLNAQDSKARGFADEITPNKSKSGAKNGIDLSLLNLFGGVPEAAKAAAESVEPDNAWHAAVQNRARELELLEVENGLRAA